MVACALTSLVENSAAEAGLARVPPIPSEIPKAKVPITTFLNIFFPPIFLKSNKKFNGFHEIPFDLKLILC